MFSSLTEMEALGVVGGQLGDRFGGSNRSSRLGLPSEIDYKGPGIEYKGPQIDYKVPEIDNKGLIPLFHQQSTGPRAGSEALLNMLRTGPHFHWFESRGITYQVVGGP